MKMFLAFSSAATLTATALPALAGGPMPQGTFTVGGERLMGIFYGNLQNDPFPPDPIGDEYGVTTFTLLGNGVALDTGGFAGIDARSMFVIPRVGLDYFIIDGLSLGGSLTLLSHSVHVDRAPDNDFSAFHFLFAPRVGYAYMFGTVVGIWPRGGFAFASGSVDLDSAPGAGYSNRYFAFEIDVPLIIAPVKNFGITVGPVFDVTFGGSQTRRLPPPELDRDASLTMFGLSAGIVGIL
jgi:hypothetical protein